MNESQREMLEREVREHGSRIAQIRTVLRELEQQASPPPQIAKQAVLLKMELRGRTAAFAVGSAHLQMDE
jgi:hypothetical protein